MSAAIQMALAAAGQLQAKSQPTSQGAYYSGSGGPPYRPPKMYKETEKAYQARLREMYLAAHDRREAARRAEIAAAEQYKRNFEEAVRDKQLANAIKKGPLNTLFKRSRYAACVGPTCGVAPGPPPSGGRRTRKSRKQRRRRTQKK